MLALSPAIVHEKRRMVRIFSRTKREVHFRRTNRSAAQELADRAEGKPRQSIEIQNTRLREAFDRMSREELENYAREGRLRAWFPREETNHERIQ
jgi:hypothetical protein